MALMNSLLNKLDTPTSLLIKYQLHQLFMFILPTKTFTIPCVSMLIARWNIILVWKYEGQQNSRKYSVIIAMLSYANRYVLNIIFRLPKSISVNPNPADKHFLIKFSRNQKIVLKSSGLLQIGLNVLG